MTTAAVDNDNNGVADDVDVERLRGCLRRRRPFLDDTPTTAPLAPLEQGRASRTSRSGAASSSSATRRRTTRRRPASATARRSSRASRFPASPPRTRPTAASSRTTTRAAPKFVSIRHAGDEIGDGNELNGLSLGGVGDGTTIENIEIYCNFDDGVEWFGGTVNGKNLAVVSFVGDDMFDLDEGYTGINQFLFGVMPFFNENGGTAYGSASGDKAGEFDGDNYRPGQRGAQRQREHPHRRRRAASSTPTPWPLSNPVMYNMTLIGSTPDAGQATSLRSRRQATNRGIQMRNGFAGDGPQQHRRQHRRGRRASRSRPCGGRALRASTSPQRHRRADRARLLDARRRRCAGRRRDHRGRRTATR